LSGESADVDKEVVNDWKARIVELCEGYEDKNIFNCDETGLYFKGLPNKSLVNPNEDRKGGKRSKERITILLCCSANGEKLKPLLIAKSETPRIFKKEKVIKGNLPVIYRNNPKAWMTSQLFNEWLLKINTDMKKQNRKVLLFLDNVSTHRFNGELSNVCLKYLPPNTTSAVQPLDQGVIENFKRKYRKKIIFKLLSLMKPNQSATQILKMINILDCCYWIKDAWSEVKTETIRNCFIKSGFKLKTTEIEMIEEENDSQEMDLLLEQIPDSVNAEEFVKFDNDLPTCETFTESWEEDFFESLLVSDNNEAINNVSDEEQANESQNIEATVCDVSKSQALECIRKLKSFALKGDHFSLYENLAKTEDQLISIIVNSQKHQTKITDYL
jgi:hypothetical protein